MLSGCHVTAAFFTRPKGTGGVALFFLARLNGGPSRVSGRRIFENTHGRP